MIGTSEAAAQMADSTTVQRDDARSPADDPPRVYATNNRTLEADTFECCCAVCSLRDQ